MSARPDCRKFSPNIFNKTKCTNCFRQKEEHTVEALESNRATRKVAKCGYLFVAPGWDFTIAVNRTKRWQRRWFVLHDDGELSYALDEHPETVPQASIDMNKVVEVANAEEMTGNAFSLAISTPDHVHFVKGTCRDEIRSWSDVLSVFPRSKGRHKRNATFPGTNQPSSHSLLQTPIRGGSSAKAVEAVCNQYNTRLSNESSPIWEGDDVYPTRDTTPTSHVSSPSSLDSDSNQRKVYMGSPPTRDKVDSVDKSSRLRRNTSGGGNNKRCIKSSTGRSYTDDLTKMMWKDQSSPTIVHPSQGHHDVNRRLLLEEYDSECKLKDIGDNMSSPRNISPSLHEPTRDSDPHKQIRGDPDGCGLDVNLRYSPSDLRGELPNDDLLNIKKGWLMKQGQEKEWTKHWFVLRGTALLYYRDPSTEDQGILDGVIDLSGVTSVSEIQVQRNYGFQITMWDERRYVLSAVTSGIRTNWMSAVRKSAGLPPQDTPSSQLSSPIQESADGVVMNSSVMPRLLLLSSDDEYRTASENGGTVGGRRESGEWGEALPPSPPLNRTPMSRVKERARGVSKLRVYGNNSKRSKSSPPSSRRSTLDSISSNDLISTSLSSVHHTNGSPQAPSADNKVASEIEEVKHELNLRLRELNNAQEELMRQRQRQVDVSHLEKLVEELSKRAEETGKQRARDAAELESLKKRFVEEKLAWEASGHAIKCELEASAARCAALCSELSTTRDTASSLASRLAELEARLEAATRENESLYARLSALDMKATSPIPPSRSRSLDSLSDLTNIDLDLEDINQLDKDRLIEEYLDLRTRFEKAVSEIRAMKRELREAHAQADWLELGLVSTRQEMKSRQDSAESSNNLMAARIQDLATKLVQSEKQIRTLKQKLSKTETREKRRSLSLKGRESLSISKEFEDKLAELEKRVNTMEGRPNEGATVARSSSSCKEQSKSDGLSLRLRRKSLDSATASEPMKVLLRLNSLEAKIGRAGPADQPSKQQTELKLFSGEELDSRESEIIDQVKKMENLLRAKLVVLAKKRESLIKNGQWNEEVRLHLLAEKLAYESVLVGRLHDAITESSANVDTSDAERLIQGLDSKLSSSGRTVQTGIDTSLDYLVRELAKHLSQQSVKRINRKLTKQDRKKRDPTLTDLVNKKAIVDAKVVNYLNETVRELAEALALESLSSRSPEPSCIKSYEDTVWNLARESVDQELVQEEIVRVMSDCTQQYQQTIDDETGSRFLCLVRDRSDLEMWASMASETLTVNMNQALSRINAEFLEQLRNLKNCGKLPEIDLDHSERTKQVLYKFADIVAHKSLLDARLNVITRRESVDSTCEEQSTGLPPPEETSLLSEIQYLYVKFCRDLTQDSKDSQKIEHLVDRLSEEICRLENVLVRDSRYRLGEFSHAERSDSGDAWLDGVTVKFQAMRERLSNMQKYAALDCKDCDKCKQMHNEISRIENDYSVKIQSIERRQEEEMCKLKFDFEHQREDLIRRHRQEEDLLLKNNTQLEKELESLSTEYNDQIKNLKASSSYDSGPSLRDSPGDSLHLRYQKEIQHLRAVCEKGLIGMENSHKRQIEELHEKHERELESLRIEKEQALAEETHATLAALDAMRKAHEAEVQKEIAKFKSEFLNKMQSNHDINAIHKQHQAEMAEIKTEILSLSEKYSVKCVENASLEDKLRSTNQQLSHAHQRILALDNRCKQLRAQMTNEGGSDNPPSPPVARLHSQSHGEVLASARRPRVVDFIPKSVSGGSGREINSEPRIGRLIKEPPPLGNPEVKRYPDKFSLCGMVSKRREEFERLLAAPTTCTSTSRV